MDITQCRTSLKADLDGGHYQMHPDRDGDASLHMTTVQRAVLAHPPSGIHITYYMAVLHDRAIPHA